MRVVPVDPDKIRSLPPCGAWGGGGGGGGGGGVNSGNMTCRSFSDSST